MRTKRIDGTQRIILTIEEARQIKDNLDDYQLICASCGYGEQTQHQILKTREDLDEAIMKAESQN